MARRSTRRQPIRTTRRGKGKGPARPVDTTVPRAFRELLEEDRLRTAGDPAPSSLAPARKRRRVGKVPSVELDELQDPVPSASNAIIERKDLSKLQTVTLSSNEEEDNWEEVDLGQDVALADETLDNGNLEIVLGRQETTTPRRRRAGRPATLEERRIRLTMHKLHILCLLYHGFLRNHWCNDKSLQVTLLH
jgi:xeroderma pigmentosum group C-complementing protein